jgi:Cytochrome c biogenesis protein
MTNIGVQSSFFVPAVPAMVAFLAGFFSFLSPCVFPLIPSYLSYISGFSVADISGAGEGIPAGEPGAKAGARISVIINSLFFILGFTIVFVLLGLFSTTVAGFIKSTVVMRISGVIIVIMGFYITGAFNNIKVLSFLNREAQFNLKNKPAGFLGSAVIGAIFAGAWTPCVGPILASILFISATLHNTTEGGFLLFIYSMGLAIPFLISGISLNLFLTAFKRFKKYVRIIQIISGVILIAAGILIFFNYLTLISSYFGNILHYKIPYEG